MAQLKDLIVAGSARLLGKTYFEDTVTIKDTLEVDAIKADNVITPNLNSDGTALAVGGNINLKGRLTTVGITSSSDISPSTMAGTGMTLGTTSKYWKRLYVGDNAGSTSSDTGSIIVNGGIGTSGNSYIGGALVSNGTFTANSTALIKGAITGQSTITTSGTGQVGNTFTIKNTSGGNTNLIFNRNGNANWQVLSQNGNLFFQCDWISGKGDYYDVLKLEYNTKQVTFFGNVLPNGSATLGGSSNKWKTLYVGNNADATSTSTGVIQATGGIGVSKSGYFGGDVTADKLHITNTSGVGHITFARGGYNYIQAKTAGGIIAFIANGQAVSYEASEMIISDGEIFPGTTAVTNLGSTSKRWKGIYSGIGDFSGNLTVSGTATIAKNTTIGNGADSESTTTGALKVTGGVGVSEQLNAKKVRIDNSVYFQYNSNDKSLDIIFG